MRKIINNLLPFLWLLIAPTIHAETKTDSPFKVTVGTEIYREIYQEQSDNQMFMQEEATMYGLNLETIYAFTTEHKLRFTGRVAKGESTYTGSYQGGTYGDLVSKGQDRSTFDLRLLYDNSTTWQYGPVTGTIGLGYRNLVDRLDQSGPGGYKRKNELYYLHLQEKFFFDISPSWRFSPSVGLNVLIHGEQHSDVLLNTQESGFGLELSAPFDKKFGANHTLTLQPFFRYWKIDDSNLLYVGGGYYVLEPSNSTKEYGLNVSLGF